eukprot:2077201-Pleurochrysis_carterae.AAC.1
MICYLKGNTAYIHTSSILKLEFALVPVTGTSCDIVANIGKSANAHVDLMDSDLGSKWGVAEDCNTSYV